MAWTLEQLRNLTELEAWPTPDFSIHLIPISRGGRGEVTREGYGSQILWDLRAYRKGVMGPRSVDVNELMGVGLSREEAESWVGRSKKAQETLNKLYPVLVPAIEERVKEIREAIPEVLPPAEAEASKG